MSNLRIIELFGGIGACTQALKKLGVDVEVVDYVEIDKYVVKSYNSINGTNFEPQDITQWNKHFDDVDLIMHGSPCQDFSLVGNEKGGDKDSGTRSSLMYETIRIVSDIKPKYVIWENVRNLLSKKHKHNFNAYIESLNKLGYKSYYKILNSKNYGIPQNRERIITISIRNDIDKVFEFPDEIELTKTTFDYLENDVDKKYYLSNAMINYISQAGTKNFHNADCRINKTIARPITTDQNKRAGTTNYYSIDFPHDFNLTELDGMYRLGFDEIRIRRLTPREVWRLMGFSDECFEKASAVNSNTQLYKQAGNSIVVNVLYEILKKLLEK